MIEVPEQGKLARGWIPTEETYLGFPQKIPIIYARGKKSGPKLAVLSTIHGDEINGVHIIHQLAEQIDPDELSGDLLMFPVINMPAFQIQSRYLPDRRDMNRLFPGKEDGSEGSRLAFLLWENFLSSCDAGIDLHSASYNRWNYPHLRGNMRLERVRYLAKFFGAAVTMHSQGVLGSLRREASRRGIPFLLFEAGQVNRFEQDVAQIGLEGIWNVMKGMEMIKKRPKFVEKSPPSKKFYTKSHWIRAESGGLFTAIKRPGDKVKKGEIMGEVVSLLGKKKSDVLADVPGRILGFNLHPQVVPGRALFHICTDMESL